MFFVNKHLLLLVPVLARLSSPTTSGRISDAELSRHGIRRTIARDGTQTFEASGGGWSSTPGKQVGPFFASNGGAGALLPQTFLSSADRRSLQQKLDESNRPANDLGAMRVRNRGQLKYAFRVFEYETCPWH